MDVLATDVFLAAAGVATPSLRLDAADVATAWSAPGGRGHVLCCAADEDALTLAWSAARDALDAAGIDAREVEGLWWGASAPPFDEGPNLAYLAAALDLQKDVAGGFSSGSRLAGADGLAAAWDAVAAGRVETALVVASDAPVPGLGTGYELHAGAGAAALVLTASEGPARLRDRAGSMQPHLDRYRGPGERSVRDVYDARLYREETFLPLLEDVADRLGGGRAIEAWALPDPDGRLGRRLAKRLGVQDDRAASVTRRVGDTGAAACLLGTVAALSAEGLAAVLAQGAGRTVGWTVDVGSPVPGADSLETLGSDARDASYAEVLRARRQLVAETDPIEMGVPPGGAGFVRGNRELMALHGARCADCGTISTPPSVHPTCIGCGGTDLTEVALTRSGTVHTFVVNQTMPAPFEAPLPLLILDLDDGARLMVHGVGDGSDLEIGDRVELVLRRYALERGASIYGFKAARVVERSEVLT